MSDAAVVALVGTSYLDIPFFVDIDTMNYAAVYFCASEQAMG